MTWRNLGRFIDVPQYVRAAQPGEHGLFVVHDQGRVLKIFDTDRRARSGVKIDRVGTPARWRKNCTRAASGIACMSSINTIWRASAIWLARRPIARCISTVTIQLVYDLIWDGGAGYVAEPPKPAHWNYWTMSQPEQFVSRLPKSATLALGVFEGEQLNIGLVLEVKQGNIVRVTTFEAPALQPIDPQLSADFLDQLWAQLDHIAPPAAVLLCEQAVFEEWIAAEDKLAPLVQAVQNGTACLRLVDQNAPAIAAIG